MVKTLKNEKWSEIRFKKGSLRFRYAVSNLGRIVSFTKKPEDGKLLRGASIGGYPTLNLRPSGDPQTFYIHKLVAGHFLPKPSRGKTYVIHKDHVKTNNASSNLKWVGKSEMEEHQQSSPLVIKARKNRLNSPVYKGHKLTSASVRQIKAKIFSRNRTLTLKQIATSFGISEMQLYRIKSGENWSHIK